MHDAEHENAIGRQQLVEHQEGRYDELANVGAIFTTIDFGRLVEPISGITAKSSVASRMLSRTRFVSTCSISAKNVFA